MMKSCDLVVCDYNYIFDPRIRWQERLDDPKHKYTLLVDEAHNLAERSRSMFSAIIDSKQIEDLKAILPQATAEADDPSLVSVLASLTELEELLNSYRNVLAEDVSETNREDFVKRHQELGLFFTQNFFATHVIPPRLESCVARLNFKLMQFFEFFRDFLSERQLT